MLRPWWRREAGRCSRYQFECRRGGECIAVYNACDGVPQCADGSDEAPELGCPAPAPPAPSAPHPPQPAQQQPVQQQQPQPPQPQPQALPAPTPAPRAPVQPLKPMQVRALSRIPFCLQELAPHSAKNENTSCHIDTKRAMVADLKKKAIEHTENLASCWFPGFTDLRSVRGHEASTGYTTCHRALYRIYPLLISSK